MDSREFNKTLAGMVLTSEILSERVYDEISHLPKGYGKRQYSTGEPRPNAQGRNDICNCLSGLKYKRCCGL